MKRAIALVPLLLCGCAPASTESGGGTMADPESWSLGEAPVLSIGVVDGATEYQLHSAQSSRKLPDGRIAVVNGGGYEVRFYDAEGRYLDAFGQEGDGPGEFRRPTHLHLTADRGLRVWDQQLRRYSLHAADGTFQEVQRLRSDLSAEPFPADVWYYRRHMIDSPVRPDRRAPIARAVSQLPEFDPTLAARYVRVTEQGRLWTSLRPLPADEPVEVGVWSLDGEPVATLTLPARFEPHDIGPDYVLGRAFDEYDVNYIVEYRLLKPEDSRSGPGLDGLRAADGQSVQYVEGEISGVIAKDLATLFKTMAGAQEMHYAEHYTYTMDTDALEMDIPSGVRVDFLEATPRGWTGFVTHVESGVYCALSYGFNVPMGWQPGALVCPGVDWGKSNASGAPKSKS